MGNQVAAPVAGWRAVILKDSTQFEASASDYKGSEPKGDRQPGHPRVAQSGAHDASIC